MKNLINKTFEIFSSLKLTAFLLMTVLVYLAVSTFVPQDANSIKYISENNRILFTLLQLTGLVNPYHNFWLVFWLYLFTFNLIACTINRIPSLSERLKRNANENYFNIDSMLKEDMVLRNTEDNIKQITNILKGKYALVNKDDTRFLIFKKGVYSPLNFLLVHLSIIIIIAGIAISALFGYEGFIRITERERESFFYKEVIRGNYIKVPLGFELALNKFENITTTEGQSIEYISEISIIDGKEIIQRKIRVNEPFEYRDMLFVQSSYEMNTENVRFKVEIEEQKGNNKITKDCSIGDTIEFNDRTFKIVDFYEDVHGMGPAIKIQSNDDIMFSLRDKPEIQKEESGINIYLKEVDIPYTSILKITYDNGTQIVFIGSVLFIISLLLIISYRFSMIVFKCGEVIEVFYAGRKPESIIEAISRIKDKE